MSSRITALKVTLDGVKPTVMRRLVVPLTISLDQLHLVNLPRISGELLVG